MQGSSGISAIDRAPNHSYSSDSDTEIDSNVQDVFLRQLLAPYNAKKEVWRNNNSTLKQYAFVFDMKNLHVVPAHIISRLFEFNKNRTDLQSPLVAVPVAGWKVKQSPCYFPLFACLPFTRKERLTIEYAQSFSLSQVSTAINADLILRSGKKAQTMKIFKKNGRYFFTVSAGVRINDADSYLFKHGLALPPNMPTLHVASMVGASANGSYGPGRDYGPMSTNIVEMKIINALGKPMTLSANENPELFYLIRDCHMGAGCFVSEITLGNIEPKFRMKRTHVLYKDVEQFASGMKENRWMEEEHFIGMYIPVDIHKDKDHFPRIRVTTFERTNEKPKSSTKCREHSDVCDYFSLVKTEAGEPLIDIVVRSPSLHKYVPFLLKFAALNTYGLENKTTEIDWSHKIAHILRTYTDLPIRDINWLIQVNNAKEASDLNIALLKLTERELKKYAQNDEYPLLNAFSRYLKGVYYPEGKGGIAPTAIDSEDQSIFSFEFVTYKPLAKTPAFKHLVDKLVKHLKKNGYKFSYHPGKHMPEDILSLSQIYNDDVRKVRLKNFKKAIAYLHEGKENIYHSPFLTPQKKLYISLKPVNEITRKLHLREDIGDLDHRCSKKQECEALKTIIELAQNHKTNDEVNSIIEAAHQDLSSLQS